METGLFVGKWMRVAGSDASHIEIDQELMIHQDGNQPVKLHVDEKTGALLNEDGNLSVTYWQKDDKTFPGGKKPLLHSLSVAPGGGRPWTAWGGETSAIKTITSLKTFQPSLDVFHFLRGVWQVRVVSGSTGGRSGDYVMVVAHRPDSGGKFPPDTCFWLCYRSCLGGPWIRYDEMTFNTDTGALDSKYGHRSLSFLELSRPPWRALYAMYYKVPEKSRLPFEVAGDDGTGTWGAEGG